MTQLVHHPCRRGGGPIPTERRGAHDARWGGGHRAWRARRIYGVMETPHTTSSWERAWSARPRATSSARATSAAGTDGDRAAAHASTVDACAGERRRRSRLFPSARPAAPNVLFSSLPNGGAPRTRVRWPRSLGVGVGIIVRSEGTGKRRHRARQRRRRSPRVCMCCVPDDSHSTTTLTTTIPACECGRFPCAYDDDVLRV